MNPEMSDELQKKVDILEQKDGKFDEIRQEMELLWVNPEEYESFDMDSWKDDPMMVTTRRYIPETVKTSGPSISSRR